jgi:hypothetical protein
MGPPKSHARSATAAPPSRADARMLDQAVMAARPGDWAHRLFPAPLRVRPPPVVGGRQTAVAAEPVAHRLKHALADAPERGPVSRGRRARGARG